METENKEVARLEFELLSGMTQEHHKRIRAIEKFIELAPDASDHHDDHLYVAQSRERMKVLINSFMDNAGKFVFTLMIVGALAMVASKAGMF